MLFKLNISKAFDSVSWVYLLELLREDIMIMAIMQCFGEATGLRINISKSSVAPIRCSELN
jgi:hypothetical protein